MRRFTRILIFQCHAGCLPMSYLSSWQINIPIKIWAKQYRPKWRYFSDWNGVHLARIWATFCIFLVHVGRGQYFHWFPKHGLTPSRTNRSVANLWSWTFTHIPYIILFLLLKFRFCWVQSLLTAPTSLTNQNFHVGPIGAIPNLCFLPFLSQSPQQNRILSPLVIQVFLPPRYNPSRYPISQ